MSWICPHQTKDNLCTLRKQKCDVFAPGCVLAGKGGACRGEMSKPVKNKGDEPD